MIVLYGATGYTGRLVAEYLARVGDPFVVAGRDDAKLRALIRDLAQSHGEVDVRKRVAEVSDRAALEAMLEDADALISAAGPFGQVGAPVVAAAVEAGVPYCDTTGEPKFMRDVAERFADAPVPVAPACGFDYVPHDLAATLAAGAIETVDKVEIALLVRGMAPSRGTLASAVGAAADAGFERAGGRLVPVRAGLHTRTFEFPPPTGTVSGISIPMGDAIQVESHIDASTVRSYLAVGSATAAVGTATAGCMAQVLGAAPVRSMLDRLVARAPEGPSPERRRSTSWGVLAEASGGAETARAFAAGRDIYGLTSMFVAEVARLLTDWQARQIEAGVRAPAEIISAPLQFAADHGFELRLID